MNIQQNLDFFHISPIDVTSVSIVSYLEAYLKRYQIYLQNNKIGDDIVFSAEHFTRHIIMCILEYSSGQRSNARELFEESIRYIDLSQLQTKIKDSIFYRIRGESDYKRTKNEMFHIPFEKRCYISEQRYSYAGEPCLYLGLSLKGCCDEKNAISDRTNVAILERSSDDLEILDLYFFQGYNFKNLNGNELSKFLLYWPLIASCSLTNNSEKKTSFSPEHIVPLLLREYLFDKNSDLELSGIHKQIYGIRYRSALHMNDWIDDPTDSYVNYAFPAIHDNFNGFCDILKRHFLVKDVRLLKEMRCNK